MLYASKKMLYLPRVQGVQSGAQTIHNAQNIHVLSVAVSQGRDEQYKRRETILTSKELIPNPDLYVYKGNKWFSPSAIASLLIAEEDLTIVEGSPTQSHAKRVYLIERYNETSLGVNIMAQVSPYKTPDALGSQGLTVNFDDGGIAAFIIDRWTTWADIG